MHDIVPEEEISRRSVDIGRWSLSEIQREVEYQPGATIRYLPQEPDFGSYPTTHDYVLAGLAPGDDPHRGRLGMDARQVGGGGARSAGRRPLAGRPPRPQGR